MIQTHAPSRRCASSCFALGYCDCSVGLNLTRDIAFIRREGVRAIERLKQETK